MKKTILVAAIGLMLAGCDKDIKEKPIAELTSEEMATLCGAPDVVNKISDNFKNGTIKDLSEHPLNYYPLIGAKQSDPEYRYKDVPFLYTAKVFEEGFGKSERFSVEKPYATGTDSDSIHCEATLNLASDKLYRKKISTPFDYRLKKEGDNYIADIPPKSLMSMPMQTVEQPTEGQQAWRKDFYNQLAAADNKIKSLPDDAFMPIAQSDIYYLYFAQAERDFADDELMSFFSDKWNSTTDSFAKEDVKKQELPKIKAKIAEYKNVQNVMVYASSNYGLGDNPDIPDLKTAAGEKVFKINGASVGLLTNKSYDFALKGYDYFGIGCGLTNGENFSNRGVSFSINRRLNACVVGVPDDQAREVSAKLSAINARSRSVEYFTRYYLHINEVDGNRNQVSTSLVREDIKMYDPDNHQLILQTQVK